LRREQADWPRSTRLQIASGKLQLPLDYEVGGTAVQRRERIPRRPDFAVRSDAGADQETLRPGDAVPSISRNLLTEKIIHSRPPIDIVPTHRSLCESA
jgi:hypothetical protein